jgi:hypothetical protein
VLELLGRPAIARSGVVTPGTRLFAADLRRIVAIIAGLHTLIIAGVTVVVRLRGDSTHPARTRNEHAFLVRPVLVHHCTHPRILVETMLFFVVHPAEDGLLFIPPLLRALTVLLGAVNVLPPATPTSAVRSFYSDTGRTVRRCRLAMLVRIKGTVRHAIGHRHLFTTIPAHEAPISLLVPEGDPFRLGLLTPLRRTWHPHTR